MIIIRVFFHKKNPPTNVELPPWYDQSSTCICEFKPDANLTRTLTYHLVVIIYFYMLKTTCEN